MIKAILALTVLTIAGALASPGQRTTPEFEPVQPELFSAGGALVNAWADPDGDGDLDLFVGFGGATANRLYRNTRGVFDDIAAAAAVADSRPTRAAAWGDFDADGDPDLLVGFAPGSGSVLRLYRNDAGRFADVTGPAGLAVEAGAVRQTVWIDVDADGDLDLFVAFRDRPNAMFMNDRQRFTDVAGSAGLADPRRSVGAVWFDYDDDGDLDVYVANMDGGANGLFRNDRGTFTDVAGPAGVAWGGRAPNDSANGTVRPCAGDFDNDGRLDLFLANYGPNGLFLNRSPEPFVDASQTLGVAIDGRHDTCALADVNHDGHLDVYVNGTVTGGVSYRDYLLVRAGGRFEDATPSNLLAFQASHGAQWADFDADGDLDLAIAGTRPDATHSLLRNRLADPQRRQSISVRVLDARGRATRAGAVVRVFRAGDRTAAGLLAARLVDAGSGYNAQNDSPVHVGLPGAAAVDVEVVWPAAGKVVAARLQREEPGRLAGRVVVVRVPDR